MQLWSAPHSYPQSVRVDDRVVLSFVKCKLQFSGPVSKRAISSNIGLKSYQRSESHILWTRASDCHFFVLTQSLSKLIPPFIAWINLIGYCKIWIYLTSLHTNKQGKYLKSNQQFSAKALRAGYVITHK